MIYSKAFHRKVKELVNDEIFHKPIVIRDFSVRPNVKIITDISKVRSLQSINTK